MDESVTAGAPGQRLYANQLTVGFNRAEFLLDFGQAYQDRSDAVHTQLVAAPAHVKQFAALLHGCLNDYEQRFGPIDPLADPPADASAAGMLTDKEH